MAAATIHHHFIPQNHTILPRWISRSSAAVLASLLCLNLWYSHREGAATSERMMARADDSPPAGRTGAMGARKNNKNRTTINRDADR
eukprot:scaffold132443_cov23-Cyclotella_meneghiniana.AAC.1